MDREQVARTGEQVELVEQVLDDLAGPPVQVTLRLVLNRSTRRQHSPFRVVEQVCGDGVHDGQDVGPLPRRGAEGLGDGLPQTETRGPLRVGKLRPRLEDPAPQPRLQGRISDPFSRWQRRQRRLDRALDVTGVVPVLGHSKGGGIDGEDARVGLQHLGPPPMPGPACAGTQRPVDALPKQGVPEGDGVGTTIGYQDAGARGLVQDRVVLLGRGLDDLLEEADPQVPVAHGSRVDQPPRVRGKPGEPARRYGRGGAQLRAPRRCGELFHHEGDAVAQVLDPRREGRGRSRPEQVAQLPANLVTVESGHGDHLATGCAHQPRQVRRQHRLCGYGPLRVVGAHRGNDQQRPGQGADREVHQVPGRRIGPVQVLHHPHEEPL